MKRFLCLLMSLVLALLCLTSCGDDTPDGFELASDPERDGYYLYVPDGWTYSHAGGVTTAYLSSLNTANITAAYVDTKGETSLAEYWATCEERLKEDFADFKAEKTPEQTIRVGQENYYAYEAEYTGSHMGLKYRFHQYLILCNEMSFADGLLVITYTGADEKNEISGLTDYAGALEHAEGVIKNFRFASRVQAPAGDLGVEDENAPEGYKRANRFEYLGMDVYVPKSWNVTISDGYIQAEIAEGATLGVTNLNLSASVGGSRTSLDERMKHYGLTYENGQYFTLIDYWNLLQKEYADYYKEGTFDVVDAPTLNKTETEEATGPQTAGESTYYAFTFMGEKYGQVYRVTLFVFRETGAKTTFRTMTYTTLDNDKQGTLHNEHIETVKKVLGEITY